MPPKKKAGSLKAATTAASRQVSVRMFCQGLGDCFLITVPQTTSKNYSIMIDCGVAMGTPQAPAIMKSVVSEIATLTKGVVDLLVVTHQHWDHVSGFVQAATELNAITFKHLWLAWTENETDPLANELRREFAKAKLVLAAAAQQAAGLKATDPLSASRVAALEGVNAFLGPAAAPGNDLAAAMAQPAKLVKKKSAIDYLKPGSCHSLPGAASGLAVGIQTFVLGPPHDRAKLVRINPSKKAAEAYEKTKGDLPGLAINWGWTASVTRALSSAVTDAVADVDFKHSQPFDEKAGMTFEEAKTHQFFADRYFADAEHNAGRRIDGDWLWSGAQRLALKMDTYTNNTSLVLAFELPHSKEVLLFAGDAQIGNWVSWHDQPYAAEDGRRLSATDLLANTRLYKVGHHGSHNATLKEQGLELMSHAGLVAMLPVEAAAVTRLGYGQMPLKSLMSALRAKTSGRILRIDDTWPGDVCPGTWDTPGATARAAPTSITVGAVGQASQRKLYMEVVLEDR